MGARRPPGHPTREPRESGLRRLADQADRKVPLKQIEHAIEKPDDPRLPISIKELVRGADSMPADWSLHDRSRALWNLIVDLIEDFDPGHGSKRQAALRIAFMI